ncbi:hypothetical protein Tco_1193492 [Tanacetum coccineum]
MVAVAITLVLRARAKVVEQVEVVVMLLETHHQKHGAKIAAGCVGLVFPSSATVYWQPEKISCVDDFGLKTMNPYAFTKIKVGGITRHDNPRELHFWEYIDAEAEVQQQTVESHGHSELLA